MKKLVSVIVGSILSICVGIPAHANWLVDETRWHVSAHGQIMCLDCHGDVGKKALHPDPARVDQLPGSAFSSELCAGCHDSVFSDLGAQRHGGQPLRADQDYHRCRDCHDPHTQGRISNPGSFDPARPAPGQCGSCHEPRERLPALPAADEACMACHRGWDPKAPGATQHSKTLCLACHGAESPAVPAAQSESSPFSTWGRKVPAARRCGLPDLSPPSGPIRAFAPEAGRLPPVPRAPRRGGRP